MGRTHRASRSTRHTTLLGITGGVATGKTTVAQMLGERGAVVLSADEAARAVTLPGSAALEQIAAAFGPEFVRPDGSLDREALGRRVFADPEARRRLEAITHPAILAALRKQIAEAEARLDSRGLIVVEAPLLYEAGMDDWFHHVVVVAAPREQQLKRLQERSELSPSEAQQRIAAQMPLEEKIARSDSVIWTGGTLSETSRQVNELAERLRAE